MYMYIYIYELKLNAKNGYFIPIRLVMRLYYISKKKNCDYIIG